MTIHLCISTWKTFQNYSQQHMQWLVYHWDSLQATHSLKDDKTRVLRYFDNKANDHLVDPTLDLKWKRKLLVWGLHYLLILL